jgi:hypothetical protein
MLLTSGPGVGGRPPGSMGETPVEIAPAAHSGWVATRAAHARTHTHTHTHARTHAHTHVHTHAHTHTHSHAHAFPLNTHTYTQIAYRFMAMRLRRRPVLKSLDPLATGPGRGDEAIRFLSWLPASFGTGRRRRRGRPLVSCALRRVHWYQDALDSLGTRALSQTAPSSQQ